MSYKLNVYWLSWWDPVGGKPGLETDGIEVWVSGSRSTTHKGKDVDQDSCCALVVAQSADEAWAKADRYYPGAAKAERRFEHEEPIGWRPEKTRFPMRAENERAFAQAERSAP